MLKYLEDGKEHSKGELMEQASNHFKLSDRERRELVPSGTVTLIKTRTSWASTYLKKAGLLESTRRGFTTITKRGLDVHKENPSTIDDHFLIRYPEFAEFKEMKSGKNQREVTQGLQTIEEYTRKTP